MDVFVAAVDLGASSGRVLLGCLGSMRDTLKLEEIHRFENGFAENNGYDCWNVEHLITQITLGLESIIDRGISLASVGIDTWAVDFVMLDDQGNLLGLPVAYRDHRTDGVMEDALRTVPREEIYQRTGIAFMQFNTLYQLIALKRKNPDWLSRVHTLLLMPDYLQYRLCGERSCEYTNASTTQLLSLKTNSWDEELLERFGLPSHWFLPLVQPGTEIGTWISKTGRKVRVITPATHDTASAVLAAPLEDEDSVYISSGTWSLMGIESRVAYCDPRALAMNITNEGGVDGTYRVLKNIMGLWLIQRLRDSYPSLSFAELAKQAEESAPFAYLINPNEDRFLNPPSMTHAIDEYCRETGQGKPHTVGEYARCVYESLAFVYRQTLDELSFLTGRQYKRIHVVGGGSQNDFLNQLCANICQLPVHTGPVEASALGNMACQLQALGYLANRKAIRVLIQREFSGKTLQPDLEKLESIERHWQRFQRLSQCCPAQKALID